MYMILTYDEFDSQSSKKAWQVWFPYKIHGFGSRSEAEAVIAEEGQAGNPYWVVQASDPVTPKRTSKVELVKPTESKEEAYPEPKFPPVTVLRPKK